MKQKRHTIALAITAAIITLLATASHATPRRAPQTPQHNQSASITLPSIRQKTYQKESFEIDPRTGDTLVVYLLHPITVYPKLTFKNDKEEEFYWRTVRNVKLTLPYAKLIRETLIETYEYLETFPTQKEREKYLKQMEKTIFEQYKPILKKLSKNQAQLLIKLIQRETDQSSYQILKAFLGSFRATFWQGFGRLFGVNLKGKFSPKTNRQDAIIDRIATLTEEGIL